MEGVKKTSKNDDSEEKIEKDKSDEETSLENEEDAEQEESDEKENSESTLEDSLNFVENHITNPEILDIDDIALQSDEIPATQQAESLENSLNTIPSGEVSEEQQNPYEIVEERLYRQAEERELRDRERLEAQQIHTTETRAINIGEIGLNLATSGLRNVGMIEDVETQMVRNVGDEEIYETTTKTQDMKMPWESGGDSRVRRDIKYR